MPKQAQIAGITSETSPAYLHTDAKLAGRLRNTPIPDGMAFIDLQGLDNATDYITHVVIVESVDGNKVHVIQGNGNPDPTVVTRTTDTVGDGYLIDFAPFARCPTRRSAEISQMVAGRAVGTYGRAV